MSPTKPTRNDTRLPCGFWRHLAVMLYDALVVMAVMIAATFLALLAGFKDVSAGRDPLFTAYLVLAWFSYLAWCWRRGGMTVGMRAWRVCITGSDDAAPGWGACLLRFGVSLLSFCALGGGFLWTLVDREKRSWHDLASATRLWFRPRPNAAGR